MDFMQQVGSLALGARLRRLGETIGQDISQIYKEKSTGFEARWFPFFQLLNKKSLSTVEIAERLGIKHPSVNAIIQELKERGLVESIADPNDKRRFILKLTTDGAIFYNAMENIWRDLRQASDELISDADTDIFQALLALESAFKKKNLSQRFINVRERLSQNPIEIRTYKPALKRHFIELNAAWIDKYFDLEEHDRKILADPEKYIIQKGGFVFFAEDDKQIVGTCALLKKNASTYELAKMRVDERYQGRKIGRRLIEACIKQAKKVGAKKIVMETNSRLGPALKLYENAGFTSILTSEPVSGTYARGDKFMALEL